MLKQNTEVCFCVCALFMFTKAQVLISVCALFMFTKAHVLILSCFFLTPNFLQYRLCC